MTKKIITPSPSLSVLSLSLSLSLSLPRSLSISLFVAPNLPTPQHHLHLHALLPVPRHANPDLVPGPPLVERLEQVPLRLDLLAVERRDDVSQDQPPSLVPGGASDPGGGGWRSRWDVEDEDPSLSDLAEGLWRGD